VRDDVKSKDVVVRRAAGDSRRHSDPAEEPAEVCCAEMSEAAVVRLSKVGKALADPIRLAMLDAMAQGRSCCGLPAPSERGVPGKGDPQGICVCELQENLGLAQSKASYHLRVLKEAGLISEEARGKWTFYGIDREGVAAAAEAFRALMRA
jgi:ArsR family transcriptional regulator